MYRRAMVNPARIDRDDEKRMLPCRYFLSGFCHKGQRCKFFHPNMHSREPFVNVPELPSNFGMVPQNRRTRNDGIAALFANRSRSRNGNGGFRSAMHSHSSMSLSPRVRSRSNDLGAKRNILSPSSHAYSQQHQNYYLDDYEYDEDDDSDEKSRSPEPRKPRKPEDQFTMFNHIDWSEFLVPGVAPPVPTELSDLGAPLSPMRLGDPAPVLRGRPLRPIAKLSNEDMPPEGFQVTRVSEDAMLNSGEAGGEKKLSAKEELHLKVKQLAKELEDEPVQHVRSLDSFFRNFKFNGYHVLGGPIEKNEENKENATDKISTEYSDSEKEDSANGKHEDPSDK